MRTPPAHAPPPCIPTLQRARAAGVPLPAGEPTAQERWCGLVVLTVLLRRRSWKDEVFQAEETVASLPRSAPPVPAGYPMASHAVVEDITPGVPCPHCVLSKGYHLCRVCRGTGLIGFIACSCGTGRISCPTCQGKGTIDRIEMRYFQDEPRHLREMYIPSHLPCHAPLFGLESAVEQAVNLAHDPPEELRCHDLSGRTAGTAYRGGERVVRPTFHGHDYGDTIERAVEGVRALGAGGQVLRHDIRAYAWPLLRLQFPPERPGAPCPDVVLYFDRGGAMRVFRSDIRG